MVVRTALSSCKQKMHAILRRLLKDNGHLFQAALDPRDVEFGLCLECAQKAKNAGRRILCDGLPSLFGLLRGEIQEFLTVSLFTRSPIYYLVMPIKAEIRSHVWWAPSRSDDALVDLVGDEYSNI